MSDTMDEDWERYMLDAMDAAAEEEQITADNASDASEVIEQWELEDMPTSSSMCGSHVIYYIALIWSHT